ncbi:MAG: hypothetical protein JWN94_1550 [Betaproteobacteria bacterium]|nr:hypothetical protein [Betaproteobacteria bacterium]
MPRRFGGRLWSALIIIAGAGSQWLAYSAVTGGQQEFVRLALAFVPLVVLACWIAIRADNKLRWSVVLGASALAVYAIEQQASWGPAAAYSLPHAAIYLSLLWLFARTLRSGHEPLITRLAGRVHGTLPPALRTYTRRATVAWCLFFAAQLIVSALLFLFGSPRQWSLFVNVLNFPLLALMFGGEYLYRIVRHGDFPHASIIDCIRAFKDDSAGARGAATTASKA